MEKHKKSLIKANIILSQILTFSAAVLTYIFKKSAYDNLSLIQIFGIVATFEYFGIALALNIYRIRKEVEKIEISDKARVELYFSQAVACAFLSIGLYTMLVRRETDEAMSYFWPVIACIFLAQILLRIEHKAKNTTPKLVLSVDERKKRKQTVTTITGRYNTVIFILLGLPTLWFFVRSIGGSSWVPFFVLVGFYSLFAVVFSVIAYFFERGKINSGVAYVANESVKLEGSASCSGFLSYREGYLALAEEDLLFVSSLISGKAELVKIPLKEIDSVSNSMTFGVIPMSFTVLNKNGERIKFHCAKRNLWVEKIQQLRQKFDM